MRIVAGKYRSRVIKSLDKDTTRPTSDKIREAIYSSIGPYFDGGIMLDLFAGSGAMSIEALSRGMKQSYAVDHQYAAIQVLKANKQNLELDGLKVIKSDYRAALEHLQAFKFDLVFLDPPYHMHIYEEVIQYLEDHDMLEAQATLIMESELGVTTFDKYGKLNKIKTKKYGNTMITYWKRYI